MKLTIHTDYALRLLLYLATVPDALVSVKTVANAFGISANHLVKVAGELARLGFVEAVRGRSGGLRLARTPDQIRIGEVVRELEPDFDLVECFHPDSNTCVISRGCALKGLLYAARSAFLATLDQCTLAELVSRPGMDGQLQQLRVGND